MRVKLSGKFQILLYFQFSANPGWLNLPKKQYFLNDYKTQPALIVRFNISKNSNLKFF